jgi:hypothetical protein
VRLYLRSSDRRPDPPPLRTNDRAAILAGMAVWAVLLVATLAGRSWLSDHGRGWWPWTPAIGLLLGCYGLYYLRRRDRREADRRAAQPPRD